MVECPTSDALRKWVVGDLPDDQAESVVEHLDRCRRCEQAVEDMESGGLLRVSQEVLVDASAVPTASHERWMREAFDKPPRTSSTSRTGRHTGRRIRDYELLEPLGRGAMGEVYRARHRQLNNEVAIKVLSDELSRDPAAAARFRREMRAVGQLDHPNIVKALDAGDTDDLSFLVMELLRGVDLAQLTSNGRALAPADACELIRQAALGMHHAHGQGLVHRDLKPSNLMLMRDGSGQPCIKILDLGLAMIVNTEEQTELTEQGQLMGTLKYMAPEQAEDTRTVDHRADIYALGASLFRLLTGQAPFDGSGRETAVQRLRALTDSAPPSVAQRCPQLDQGLVVTVDRMLARSPDDRPQTMATVAESLEEPARSHRLQELLQRSLTEPAPSTVDDHNPAQKDTTPSMSETLGEDVCEPRPKPATPVPEQARSPETARSRDADRSRPRFALPVAGVFGVLTLLGLVLGGVIWVQTDGGYLRIETTDPSVQVTVQVLRDGKPWDRVRIGTDAKAFWYRSGKYEIRLPREVRDQLMLSPSTVKLRRAGSEIVKISKVVKRSAPPDVKTAADRDNPTTRTEIVKWCIDHMGSVTLTDGRAIRHVLDVPPEPFQIDTIHLGDISDDDLRRFSAWLPQFPNCVDLALFGGPQARLTDASIPVICRLQSLRRLALVSQKLTDAGFEKLTPMPNVRSLSLGETMLRKAGLQAVRKNFPSLTHLSLQSRVMRDQDLEPLVGCPRLRQLGLNLQNSNSAVMRPLARLKIEELTLREPHTWHDGLVDVLAKSSHLRNLMLANCTNLTDANVMALSRSGAVSRLRIFLNTGVTADGLVAALKENRRLYLDLGRPLADSAKLRNHPQVLASGEGPTRSIAPQK